MQSLTLTSNFTQADDFYADLLMAHEGLSEAETHALNARLVLLLANHIGEHSVLTQALRAAQASASPTSTPARDETAV